MLWSVATVKAKIILINLADQKKKKNPVVFKYTCGDPQFNNY